MRYYGGVLGSFADKDTEVIWNRRRVRKFDPVTARIALRKLLIRINDQWRICFKWTGSGPTEVEIVDYH